MLNSHAALGDHDSHRTSRHRRRHCYRIRHAAPRKQGRPRPGSPKDADPARRVPHARKRRGIHAPSLETTALRASQSWRDPRRIRRGKEAGAVEATRRRVKDAAKDDGGRRQTGSGETAVAFRSGSSGQATGAAGQGWPCVPPGSGIWSKGISGWRRRSRTDEGYLYPLGYEEERR
jgi:hypothetical protein